MTQPESKLQLNIGCGNKKIPGFINIDSREETNPDLVCDLFSVDDYFKPKSVDLIYLCHVLEHLQRNDTESFLLKCKLLLKENTGVLRISVPDFSQIVSYYHLTGNIKPLQTLLYGGHKYKEDYHFVCFDYNSLSSLLLECGFSYTRKYDWKLTEHAYIDDYSQAYLPHMDKVNGMLMSLNVEAR